MGILDGPHGIGTEHVQKSDPDGYTLLLGQSGPISINPAVYKNLPYDPLKDFAPVSMTTAYPYIMVVSPALGVKTVQEFVALARHKPGALNYGTTGVGAANHLVTELFDSMAGITMTHIPYRGTAPAANDVAKVENWLRNQGFSIIYTPKNSHYVSAEGSVAQLTAAFGAHFGLYNVQGQTLRSPAAEVSIPSTLAGVIKAVIGLDESYQFVETHRRVEAQALPTARTAFGFPASRATTA